MLTPTNHIDTHVDKFSDVVVTRTEPLPQEELDRIAERRRTEEIQYAMYRRSSMVDFLTPTDHSYRENSGAEPLDISLADGSEWSDVFDVLRGAPKRFFQLPTEAFVGETSSGEKRTPSIPTIQKEFDRQAWRHGLVLGYKGVPTGETKMQTRKDENGNETEVEVDVLSNDEFMVTARSNVTKLPKRLQKLGLRQAEYGVALEETEEQ